MTLVAYCEGVSMRAKSRAIRKTSFVAALFLFGTTTFAQHASFAKVQVSDGPVIEYPAHWKIADEATIQNRVHSGQATADAAGVDMSGFQKRNRVVIESPPKPSTAQIRASIVTPQDYTQVDLQKATTPDLLAVKANIEKTLQKLSAGGAVKLHKMGEPTIEKIADRLALVIPYTRFTTSDPVVWQVQQIKIPFEDRMLSLTIEYRTTDAATMKPILERVKKTLIF